MVLKRLLVTALGALGLGALATGPALGQDPGEGNIPAPNLFDDQIACTMNLPMESVRAMNRLTVVPMGEMTSPLDTAIGMGDAPITEQATLDALGYVIPPDGNNCGQGMGATVPTVDGMEVGFFAGAQDASIPMDVAEGYSTLLEEFKDVYGDPGDATTGAAGALDDAREALAMANADTTEAQLKVLQDAVDEALAEYNKQKAEFDAIASGPIYAAGVAEWMAKSDVTNAIAAYNTAVGMAATTKTALDGLNYATPSVDNDGNAATPTSKYVPLGAPNALVGGAVTISNGMVTIGTAEALRTYANADGSNFATVDSMTGVTTIGTSNFDRNGNLVVPMAIVDPDGTPNSGDEVLRPTVSSAVTSVADIRTVVDNTNLAAEELKKVRDEIGPGQLAYDLYDEVYKRAQAEADYYNELWADLLADTTDHRTADQRDETNTSAYVKDPITIAGRNAAYVRASNTRSTAEADLRAKAAAREAATEAVVDAFQTPASFYNQLVARRQALKFAADKAVADAENPSTRLTDAATAAATKLTEAEDAQSNFQSLFSNASDPVQELVTEMLKEGGDDGQKLVDAISGSYDAADAAKMTADEAKTTADKVAEDVEGLTGDDGAVSKNTKDIEALDGRVAMNEGEIWDADGNSRIDANEMRSQKNEMAIFDEAGNSRIAMNELAIQAGTMEIYGSLDTSGESRIDANETRSMGNETRSMANETRSMANETRSMANETRSMSNETRSMENATSINGLRTRIGMNESDIVGLQDQMEIVRAGVAASMALAGMPAINGRGISIGVGSFDGESAFAVGFQIQSDMASFKVGVTSAGGETGASAGVGFQF